MVLYSIYEETQNRLCVLDYMKNPATYVSSDFNYVASIQKELTENSHRGNM